MTEKWLAYFQSGIILELTNISQNICICIYVIFHGITTEVTTIVSGILNVILKQSHQRLPTSYPEPGRNFGIGRLFALLQDVQIQHTCNLEFVTYNTGGGEETFSSHVKRFDFLFVNMRDASSGDKTIRR